MLGVFAEFETTCVGNDSLKELPTQRRAAFYKGRKAGIDAAKIEQMKADGMGPSAIAKALKIGRASVYRALTS